jgi:hypothetical protein
VLQGPNTSCLPITSQNVGVRFGDEFPCLNQPFTPVTTTTTTSQPINNCGNCWLIDLETITADVIITDCFGTQVITIDQNTTYLCSTTTPSAITGTIVVTSLGDCETSFQCGGSPFTTTTTTCPQYCDVQTGFYANKFEIICQKVDGEGRPNSSEWKIIDFTDQLMSTMINGFITKEGLINNTFVITKELYDNAPYYDLNNYIPLTPVGYTATTLNFGDEYYFYGSLETDIQATIYEMRYKINLGQAEFQSTTNPTWTQGTPSYITEIGLYDSDKTLMIASKLQSPVLRQGVQQFLVKFDF